MANPIGHLSHKKFADLTPADRIDVCAAYNDFNKYPDMRSDPGTFKLERFWDSWNYEGDGKYDADIDYINNQRDLGLLITKDK